MPQTMVKPMDYAALGIKVEALEGDVREVKDSILGLDSKIEKSISGLAHEVRTSITALSNQFAERQRTPWAVLISGAGFMVAVLGIYGSQALSPISADIKDLKANIVPRVEHDYRQGVSDRRVGEVERRMQLLIDRRYEEMREEIRDLKQRQTR